jgi:hypothetical protein
MNFCTDPDAGLILYASKCNTKLKIRLKVLPGDGAVKNDAALQLFHKIYLTNLLRLVKHCIMKTENVQKVP